MPSRLFINHVDTGANAGQIFLQKVDSVSAQFLQSPDSPSPMVCSRPEYRDFSPEAAMVSLLDYTGRSGPAELVWTLNMKNGDTIKLRQKIKIDPIETYDYHYEDYPMDTVEQLQTLVDQITKEVPLPAVVNLHLPPVTYEGGLTIENRPINLYGSQEGDRRTTFTDTVRVAAQNGPILYFYDLDFTGHGEGIGVSASARFWAEGCSFTGWKTGMLGYGYAWVNVIACQFADNEVGFHFNSNGGYVNHTMFNEDVYKRQIEKYSIIYADPPWRYSAKKVQGAAENHYPTMSIDELCALPVAELAAKDSALFMWATFPQLPEALRLIRAWGFTYKSVAFVWLKKNKKADSWFYGLGFWTRANAEICLLATKGHPKRQAADIHQFIISPIEAHSKKPDETRDKICLLYTSCTVLLAGCNTSSESNEEQSLKVYSFSGENEYISVSNGVKMCIRDRVGTGKSYFAGCIANALMEKEIPVRMTNFALILNDLAASFEGRNEYILSLIHI